MTTHNHASVQQNLLQDRILPMCIHLQHKLLLWEQNVHIYTLIIIKCITFSIMHHSMCLHYIHDYPLLTLFPKFISLKRLFEHSRLNVILLALWNEQYTGQHIFVIKQLVPQLMMVLVILLLAIVINHIITFDLKNVNTTPWYGSLKYNDCLPA